MKKALAMAVVAMMVVAMVGCGGGKYATPTTTMQTMHAAAKAGDKEAMKACFSADTLKKINEIEKMSADFAKENPEFADKMSQGDISAKMVAEAKDAKMEYGEEKIDGDKATLAITADGKKDTVEFVKEGGAWKLHLPITDAQVEMMKKGMEMMKNMPKGMMEGLKDMGDKMKKDLEKK